MYCIHRTQAWLGKTTPLSSGISSNFPWKTPPEPSGWWLSHPSEKYELVSWDDDIPNIWKNKIHVPNISKPPTRVSLYRTGNPSFRRAATYLSTRHVPVKGSSVSLPFQSTSPSAKSLHPSNHPRNTTSIDGIKLESHGNGLPFIPDAPWCWNMHTYIYPKNGPVM